MGWFETVRDAVYDALCAVFKLNPASSDALKRFVPAYIKNATNTQAPRNMNICYYAISELQGSGFDYIQERNTVVKGVPNIKVSKTIPVSVLITFYGDSADNDSETFWSRFQFDSGAGSARSVLRKKNIVPIGKPDRPVSLYEEEGTFHRRRCDVRLNLAYLESEESAVGYVDEVPDIVIQNN